MERFIGNIVAKQGTLARILQGEPEDPQALSSRSCRWWDGPENLEEKKRALALDMLDKYLLPHCKGGDERQAVLGRMAGLLLDAVRGAVALTDKDSMLGRRIKLGGEMLGELFRDAFFSLHKRMQRTADAMDDDAALDDVDAILRRLVDPDLMTQRWIRPSFRDKWKRAGKPVEGVTQALERTSLLGTTAHLRRVANYLPDEAKRLPGPHRLHCSSWGLYCPLNTPAGGDVGLRKHLALGAVVSPPLSSAQRPAIDDILRASPSVTTEGDDGAYVIHNGRILVGDAGWPLRTREPSKLVGAFRTRRTALVEKGGGRFWKYVSVTWNRTLRAVVVQSGSGRLLRPLFVAQPNKDGTHATLSLDVDATASADALVKKRVVEYVDTSESDGILVAESVEHFTTLYSDARRYTHCEVHPALLFGAMASMIPFAEMNPGTRDQFSCRQGKSAIGITTSRFFERTDRGVVKTLNYPQRPLVSTRGARTIGAETLPAGMNGIVAIMCYTGYNQEDALILNSSSSERGFMNSLNTRTYFVAESKDARIDPEPPKRPSKAPTNLDDGIVRKGTEVHEGDVLVSMVSPSGKRLDVRARPYETGVVSREPIVGVQIDEGRGSETDEMLYATVQVSKVKTPAIGDKFCFRYHGQKGMCGRLIRQGDMPFTASGLTPDVIVNPHAFPSRMTLGQFMEGVGGKLAVLAGARVDATFQDHVSTETMRAGLEAQGFIDTGEEELHDPLSGRRMRAKVFIGPTFYRRLVQQVADKYFYRTDTGALTPSRDSPSADAARAVGCGWVRWNAMRYWPTGSPGSSRSRTRSAPTACRRPAPCRRQRSRGRRRTRDPW